MPVDDHPVHEKTKKRGDEKPGCYNRTGFAAGYYAPNRRYRPDGTFFTCLEFIKTEWIKYEKCPNSHYEECRGCTW